MKNIEYFYDLETDGLRKEATKIHIGVFKNKNDSTDTRIFLESEMNDMVEFLRGVDTLISHNGIGYDEPIMEKLLGFKWEGNSYDTLVLSRILSPNRMKPFDMYPTRAGPHSVEVWAYRLGGEAKVENEDWSVYTENMRQRCITDVNLQEDIYYALQEEMSDGDWSKAVPMSMKLFQVFDEIEQYGWKIDTTLMHSLVKDLEMVHCGILEEAEPLLPYVIEQQGVTIKPFTKAGNHNATMVKWLEKRGAEHIIPYIAGAFSRINIRRIDINKRGEVIELLLNEGWKPEEWNINKETKEKTSPKLSQTDGFDGIESNIGQLCAKFIQVRHRKSLLEGLLKLVREDGRIGQRVTGLTPTARSKHAGLVNIPSINSFFGEEIRSVFIASEGKVLVGCDSAGNQLRQLASVMDDEEYKDIVVNSDIHEYNRVAAGLDTRTQAKGMLYGTMFGGGDAKIGELVGGGAKEGKDVKDKFFSSVPKFKEMLDSLVEEWRTHARKKFNKKFGRMEYSDGWIDGLDGRPIYAKSEHQVLNYKLQSMEGIQMSLALLFLRKWLGERFVYGEDCALVAMVHDEYTIECIPEIAGEVSYLAESAIRYAGEYLHIDIEHKGEAKYGITWADIH